jgi:hypothetical protein
MGEEWEGEGGEGGAGARTREEDLLARDCFFSEARQSGKKYPDEEDGEDEKERKGERKGDGVVVRGAGSMGGGVLVDEAFQEEEDEETTEEEIGESSEEERERHTDAASLNRTRSFLICSRERKSSNSIRKNQMDAFIPIKILGCL